jgi:GT2 family glycosyltransferase
VKTAISLEFDETLGVGAKYPSAEDTDFALRTLALKGDARYSPDVICYHKYQKLGDPSRQIVAGFIMGRHLRHFPELVLPAGRWLLRRFRHGPDRMRSLRLTLRGLFSRNPSRPVTDPTTRRRSVSTR